MSSKHSLLKNIFFRIIGKYSSFTFSIVGIFIYHIVFVISVLLLCLWYWVLMGAFSGDAAELGETIKKILIAITTTFFLLKIYCALCIFSEQVNITEKFKFFILVESMLNPFGITFSMYKLLHSKIYYLKKECPFKHKFNVCRKNAKNTFFPTIHDLNCDVSKMQNLLSVRQVSCKYHGGGKWDQFWHNILKKISPRFYAQHMKYSNNTENKDTELSEIDDFNVLHNIDIDMNQDRFITVLGCNGSGKSTFLKVINKIIENYEGKVMWMGKDIKQINNKSFAQNISNVSQETIFYTNISVYEYVSYGLFPHDKSFLSIINEENQHKILEILKLLNLDKYTNKFISELSGGEKQKCILARALVQDTKVIILDEPTTFLDIYSQYHVLELFKKIQMEKGITIIAILHDIQQAKKFSDDVVLLDGGMIYKYGTTEEVLTELNINYLFK